MSLIHNNGYSISRAAKMVNIYYPTAKAINKVYLRENRIQKKTFRSTTQTVPEEHTPAFANHRGAKQAPVVTVSSPSNASKTSQNFTDQVKPHITDMSVSACSQITRQTGPALSSSKLPSSISHSLDRSSSAARLPRSGGLTKPVEMC